jgi:hypothetical protein
MEGAIDEGFISNTYGQFIAAAWRVCGTRVTR